MCTKNNNKHNNCIGFNITRSIKPFITNISNEQDYNLLISTTFLNHKLDSGIVNYNIVQYHSFHSIHSSCLPFLSHKIKIALGRLDMLYKVNQLKKYFNILPKLV